MDSYQVEEIIGFRLVNNKEEYKIKWQDFPIEESTWEPVNNLSNVKYLVQKYNKENKIGKNCNIQLNKSK